MQDVHDFFFSSKINQILSALVHHIYGELRFKISVRVDKECPSFNHINLHIFLHMFLWEKLWSMYSKIFPIYFCVIVINFEDMQFLLCTVYSIVHFIT